MAKFMLTYSAPRLAQPLKDAVAWELRNKIFEARGYADASQKANRFLREGSVSFGGRLYQRSLVSLVACDAPARAAQSKPEFAGHPDYEL